MPAHGIEHSDGDRTYALTALDELWRSRYRARRYLEHATQAELVGRFRCMLENVRQLAPDGKMSIRAMDAEQSRWWELLTHVLEENGLRGLHHGALAGEPLWNAISGRLFHEQPPPAAAALRAAKLPANGSFLAKLSERKYLEPLLRGDGTLKISPASRFSDRSLNPATRDDELSLTVKRLGREVTVEVRGESGRREFRPDGLVSFTSRTKTDYYVCCFAAALPLRLFDDFEADAALVIRNGREFFRRVDRATRTVLGDDWTSRCGPVTYIDPYHARPPASVYFAKPFDYAYQREHRFVWLPPSPIPPGLREPIYVNPGRLDDIGFLVTL